MGKEDSYRWNRWDFYGACNGWSVLDVGYGASVNERVEWRDFHIFVSRNLNCLGFLFFVYDGDYWGYDLAHRGTILDQFVQNPEEGASYWPSGTNLSGNLDVLLAYFPWLSRSDLEPYLVHAPSYDDPHWTAARKRFDVKAHPDDEYTRADQCAVLDFLRRLRVPICMDADEVRFTGDCYRSVWMKDAFFTDADGADLRRTITEMMKEQDMQQD